ncbi:SulP family inorganic anion transporter [Janibacter terrae]|uniref:SulP family inorganic anion transporter n=1 Tax=Janibacter terrae TaxID=103817 RepID=UPI001FE089FD|nr:SulP family inorganic anion transporter [Janibacter terrae]
MAYAAVAGLPPVAGLWAAMAALSVYAVLGSSPQLSVGPESTTALMTAVALGTLGLQDAQEYAARAATLAVLVGAICVMGWVLRLGFVAEALRWALSSSTISARAAVESVAQIGPLYPCRTNAGR